MNRYIFLENIANGIHAANRIKHLQNASTRNSDSGTQIDSIALISEIIQSVAQYSPENSRSPLATAGTLCRDYCHAYRSFKNYLRQNRSPGINKDQFVDSLRILEPLVDTHKKKAIYKIMKIYELFN